ncbi:sensor histidine kinase [Reichenbachiella ulvae]|uniref:histidine kinase n=1 Tax=Reichenbachiella ulvae TaxID=2980104 RepID=A0ABT3CZ31_9BACT|nr:ATP-binding protein [Reichenbachiella ulvae]MCV9388953.1 ATP-binding protein [Reichenbachiella ulvae]
MLRSLFKFSSTSSGHNKYFSRRSLVVAIVLSFILLGLFEAMMYYRKDQITKEEEIHNLSHVNELVPRLERELSKLIYLSSGVDAYLQVYHDSASFEAIVAVLEQVKFNTPFIRSLGLSRGTVLKYVAPLEGNERAIGIDYKNYPDQWPDIKRIIESRKQLLSGPINLVQGGEAFIYRSPVIIDGEYWGLLSIVMDIEKFFQETLAELKDKGYHVSIRKLEGGAMIPLYGNQNLFQQNPFIKLEHELLSQNWQIVVLHDEIEDGHNLFFALLWLGRGAWLLILVITIFALQASFSNKMQNEKYELLAKNITDVIWIYNLTQNRFEYVSPSKESYSGLNPDQLRNINIGETLTEESRAIAQNAINESVAILERDGYVKSVRLELQQYKADGELIWIEVDNKLTKNEKGEIEILGVSRDINEKKLTELELIKNREQLMQLNVTKDSFFSIIGHDLKSPLSSMTGTLEFLLSNYQSIGDEERQKFLSMCKDTSDHAFKLLENLLTWARAQSRDLAYNPEPISVKGVAEDVAKLLHVSASNKSITLKINLSPTTIVMADLFMLSTILRNLISNALKFTNEGGEIKVEAIDQTDFIEISVKDNGVGIDEEVIPNLFRIDKKTTTKGTHNEKGTGLGLVLCQEFVQRHGGSVRVESKKGEGSTFYFTVPKA